MMHQAQSPKTTTEAVTCSPESLGEEAQALADVTVTKSAFQTLKMTDGGKGRGMAIETEERDCHHTLETIQLPSRR